MRRLRAALLLLLLLPPAAAAGGHIALDPQRSHFGFEIRTRLGQRIEGEFPRFEGRIEILADGRRQVRLRMFSQYVQIPGKPRYTGWMRGEDFFDTQRHPVVEFDSLPFEPELVSEGGDLQGTLTLRGIRHRETLRLMPAGCDRPGYDCDLVGRGTVLRGRYGMDGWHIALSDRVTFLMRGRLTEVPTP